jgi:hypothetical protein
MLLHEEKQSSGVEADKEDKERKKKKQEDVQRH